VAYTVAAELWIALAHGLVDRNSKPIGDVYAAGTLRWPANRTSPTTGAILDPELMNLMRVQQRKFAEHKKANQEMLKQM